MMMTRGRSSLERIEPAAPRRFECEQAAEVI